MEASHLRTVFESHEVRNNIDKARTIYKLEELWDGLVWRLSREPEKGKLIKYNGKSVYARIIDPDPSHPAIPGILAVYDYRQNINEVEFLFIRIDNPK